MSKDRQFYKTLVGLVGFVALQNVIAFTVNMADNIMLGSYSQDALSGASIINQIFFLIQQFGVSVANTLVALSAQYWGEKRISPIRTLSGYALKLSLIIAICLIIVGTFMPGLLCRIFTPDAAIIAQGVDYMRIVIWSFGIFCITSVLYAALRAVGIVKISFYTAIVTLVVNCGINYVLIFGKLGFPELGIKGAAIGTLISRIVEFIIMVLYCKKDKVLALWDNLKEVMKSNKVLRHDFYRLYMPNLCATVVWGISIPIQTAILGHLSGDALAANSVASTFYQYAKVVTMAMSSCSGVMIGKAIGEGNRELVKQYGRTLSILDIILGAVLALVLFVLRGPLLSLYSLNPTALALVDSLIILQAILCLAWLTKCRFPSVSSKVAAMQPSL